MNVVEDAVHRWFAVGGEVVRLQSALAEAQARKEAAMKEIKASAKAHLHRGQFMAVVLKDHIVEVKRLANNEVSTRLREKTPEQRKFYRALGL